MLIMTPFAGVLVLNMLQDKTVLCYIHKLQSQIINAEILGFCTRQDKIVLCYTHYIMQRFAIAISFSGLEKIKENISVMLLAFHQDYTKNSSLKCSCIYSGAT
jgi:hypothetical protein